MYLKHYIQYMRAESVAWFFMGEGSVHINFSKHPEMKCGFRTFPQALFANTDIETLKPISSWLKKNKIPHQIWSQKPKKKNWSVCYRLCMSGFSSCKPFLEKIYPYLVGRKKEEVKIMLEYINKFKRREGYRRSTFSSEAQRLLDTLEYRDRICKLTHNKGQKTKYTHEYVKQLLSKAKATA